MYIHVCIYVTSKPLNRNEVSDLNTKKEKEIN